MGSLMHAYYFYSALLALKLLALFPISYFICNPEKVQRANLSDLKHLTPFWLVAGLYVTTLPDRYATVNLMRMFALARLIAASSYVWKLPKHATEGAFFVSFLITCYMGVSVLFAYKDSL